MTYSYRFTHMVTSVGKKIVVNEKLLKTHKCNILKKES